MLIVIILLLNILLPVYVAAFINKGEQRWGLYVFFLHLKPVLVSQETFLEGSHLESDVYVEWCLTALDYTCVL